MVLLTSFLAFAAAALAAPTERRQSSALIVQQQATTPALWSDGWVQEYPIHASCNSTETALLRQAFDELKLLAQHAKDHIARFGNSSSYYLKYFGDAATGEPAGWYDKVLNSDKAGVLFRCDDIDGNCAANPDTWAGHWRGENASDETVICERSFTSRWPLAGLCGYGYTVAGYSTASYFASDLLHRLFHTDKIGESVVSHYADTYKEVLELAKNDSALAVRNSATLRYFALDVYAYDIAVPGVGCTGVPPLVEAEDGGPAPSSASSAGPTATSAQVETSTAPAETTSAPAEPTTVSTETSTAVASASVPEATTPSVTTTAAGECHTHDNGDVHCV